MGAEKKTIYVDMDDVLCRTAKKLLAIVEREFGKRLIYEQLYTFDVCQACGLQPREVTEFYRIINQPDELLSLEPMEGAIPGLQQWIRAGYEIAIVTGRPPTTYESSIECLSRQQVPYHSFTVVDKYGRFETQNTSGITLAELADQKFCWAVEDSLPMAKYLADQMGIPVALLDHPWNRAEIEHPGIKRYNQWHELAQALPKRSVRKPSR